MELDYIIHPDKSSIYNFILGPHDTHTSCSVGNSKLYSCMISRGSSAFVITPETEKRALRRISETPINRLLKRKCLERLDAFRQVTEIKKVDRREQCKVSEDVRAFFREFANGRPSYVSDIGINIDNVSPPFRKTVIDSAFNNCEKSYFKLQEEEDIDIFSGMVLNMDPKKTNFLISTDYHFVGSGIRKAIEDRYGFNVNLPSELLMKVGRQPIYLPAGYKY